MHCSVAENCDVLLEKCRKGPIQPARRAVVSTPLGLRPLCFVHMLVSDLARGRPCLANHAEHCLTATRTAGVDDVPVSRRLLDFVEHFEILILFPPAIKLKRKTVWIGRKLKIMRVKCWSGSCSCQRPMMEAEEHPLTGCRYNEISRIREGVPEDLCVPVLPDLPLPVGGEEACIA